MGVLGRYGTSALKYYGSILASAYANVSTSDMWTAIHGVADQYGLPSPQTQPPDVSVIRGFANKIANGARTLAAADPTDTILPTMMATAPYTSRDQQSIDVNPVYQVRYLNTVQADDGTTSQSWQTSVFTATDFPDTVGGLYDAIQTNATEIAAQSSGGSVNTPKGTSINVSNLEITLV
jgi:hypothetical protein